MARKIRNTYAVRLTVEDGGKAKAELVDVGNTGDKSLDKIRKGGKKASRGLDNLTDRARSLARQMQFLKAAAFAAAGAGGLALLLKNSVDTAKNIRDMSNRAGVAVETFQELEFAARQFGVQQDGLADGLKELALRADEFVKTGSGPAAEAFAALGLSREDLRENLDNVDALFDQVLSRFQNLDTQAQKIRVLDEVFGGTAGEQFLEFMDQGNNAIHDMRQSARDFGVVFSGEFIDKAVTAENQINTLGSVIKTNFQRGLIEGFVDEFGDLSGLLKDPEFKQAVQDLGLLTADLLRLLGTTAGFLNDVRNGFVTGAEQVGESLGNLVRRAQGRQTVDIPELGFSKNTTDFERFYGQGPTLDTPLPFSPVPETSPKPDPETARDLQEENDLRAENTELTNQQADADRSRGKTAADVNKAVVTALEREIAALGKSERQNFIDQAVRRLSADATEAQRREVERIAGAFFDEQQAMEERRKEEERRKRLIEDIKRLTEEQASAQDKYNQEMAELNRLLKEGAINQQEFEAASKRARDNMLQHSREWSAGVQRALQDYAAEATDMASQVQQVTMRMIQGLEDALVEFTTTGKFNWRDMVDSMIADITRLIIRTQITGPLAGALNNVIGGFFANADGNVFSGGMPVRAFGHGTIVHNPTVFPMANGIGLMGEEGPEAIMPLRRLPSGRLGVESTGNNPTYAVNVDARGATDPAATSRQVEVAVDRALSARVPGIVRTSVSAARSEVVDMWHRRGGRFD
jgi:lambda family phage tail tape measure protein